MIKKYFPKEQLDPVCNHQRTFISYVLAILIDLTVLNLFNEHWSYVAIESFSISLLAAILLQVLLRVTIAIEHRIAVYFKAKAGIRAKISRILSTWFVLFSSKIIILEAINLAFGDQVLFSGPIHGLVAFVIVVITILIAEQLIGWLYRSLAMNTTPAVTENKSH